MIMHFFHKHFHYTHYWKKSSRIMVHGGAFGFFQYLDTTGTQVKVLQSCACLVWFFISSHATYLCFRRYGKLESSIAMCWDGKPVRALRRLRLTCGCAYLNDWFTYAHIAGCVSAVDTM